MVIVRIFEGLGNQMFQYAYARAKKEKGSTVRLDLDEAFKESFTLLKHTTPRKNRIQNFKLSIPSINVSDYGKYSYLYQKTMIHKIITWLAIHFLWKYRFYEEKTFEYSKKAAKITGNCYIKGYFQDRKYFEDIRPILLKEFTPRKKIRISTELRKALEETASVSIHVRRGDYVRLNWSLNPVYYKKAVSYIKKIFSDPVFLIFSDDLDWVKKNMCIDGRCIYVNENGTLEDYEELLIMSKCKANIIANSTFSWWAAWLNTNKEKVVVAPRKWKMEHPDLLPDEWIIV